MPASSVPSDSEDSDGFIITNHPTRDYADCSPLSTKELAKVRRWLEPTAYDISGGEYRKHTSSYLSGTGSWLTASSEYQQWLTGENHGLLWIKGIPGSGKSVMAAKIIADLTASEPESPVLYFFFRQIIDANHEPSALLRDWMDQLLRHSPTLQQQLYSHVKSGDSWSSVSQDDMWKYLKSAFASLSATVYCVTDALDEMDRGNDAFLQALANLGHWRPDKVKVLITSRPVSGVETPLHLVPCLKIRLREEEVDNDIARFVKHSLESSQIDQKHWPKIINAVPGRANGLFLYARLAMNAFLEPGADVETALARLPTDLNILYTNLLGEHVSRSGVDGAVQKLMLQAATHATRPLRLLEAAEMLGVVGVVGVERNLKARKKLVRTACGPLLEILADETVSVIHHSFTEYLRGTTRPQADSGYPPLASGAAHEQLASACLRHLCSGILDNFPADYNDMELCEDGLYSNMALWKKHPFLKYAASNWFNHVVAACSASSDDTRVLAETRQLLENDSWRRASCHIGRTGSTWDDPKAHVAACLGLTGYIKELARCGENIDAVDMEGRTPLWWAASEGHADTVQALIAAGARPEGGKTDDGDTPLHQAANENHSSVVDLLLRAGVSPMIRKIRKKGPRSPRSHFDARCTPNDSDSPLRYACAQGHLETVSVMVKHITNLGTIYSALAWAACRGRARLVSLLLGYPGVDVNARVRGDTLLYLACGSLNFETVDVLLRAGADPTVLSIGEEHHMTVDTDYVPEPTGLPTQSCLRAVTGSHLMECDIPNPVAVKGIGKLFSNCFLAGLDVNQRDRTGQTLLHQVAGSAELTQLLLSEGADAKAVDKENKTPLHFAWNPDVVSILVKVGGADVNAMDASGQTPLHGAVFHDYKLEDEVESLAFVSKLLEYGADPNIVDNEGCTVLHRLPFWITADATIYERVALLLRSGADPNLKDHEGLTPLRKIHIGHAAGRVVDCLVQAGADIDSRDNTESTALFQTVGQGSIHNVRFFLKAGASKQSCDFQGRTMAHQAIRAAMCKNNIDDVVQWLHELASLELVDLDGADLEAVDDAGNNLLHELCSLVKNNIISRSVETFLVRLLTESGLDISRQNHAGHTPLHLLCTLRCEQGGSWSAFDLPIAHAIRGCRNIDERDSRGNTPLHIASAYEQTWCKMLLDAGADPTLRNHDGLTPLHLAARCKQSNVVGMLLEAIHDRLGDTPSKEAAVINATVLNSWYSFNEPVRLTALFYACQSGRPESVQLLLYAGADPNIGNLFVACAMMEQENRLWEIKNPPVAGEMVALGLFDTKRPPMPNPTDLLNPFASTRLEEILDMLISAGIELSLLDSDPLKGHINPFEKASQLHSDYAYRCLDGIKTKYREKMQGISACVAGSDPLLGLSILDGRMVALRQDESKRMIQQSGWLQPEGVDPEIFRAIIVRRQYHLIAPMIEAGCRFLLPGIPHLQYLIVHGLASVFDQIAEAETQSRLSEGEWHASGDPSKPGLHFQPKVQEDKPTKNDRRGGGEARNRMLEYAVSRALPNMEIVELLVSKYAVNIDQGHGGNGNTALHVVARGHHWWQAARALPFLINSGADIESRNSSGQTPLHVALDQTRDVLGKLGPFHKDVAKALINAGADTNAINSKGQSCIDVAAYSIGLIDLLVGSRAVIHASSLFSALDDDNIAALEILLDGGADANGRMQFAKEHSRKMDGTDDCHLCGSKTFDLAQIPCHEMVPVYYLASKPAFLEYAATRSCFRKLLEHGADIYATFQVQPVAQSFRGPNGRGDYDGRLGLADEPSTGREERSVLHELVRLGKLSKYFIDAVNIDPDSRDPKGRTLLHAICDSRRGPDGLIIMPSEDEYDGYGEDEGEQDVVDFVTGFRLLLDLGCDIKARDNNGQSVVHHMIYGGWRSPETLKCLEKSMAEVARLAPELLNAPNAAGNTPFHYSALLTASARETIMLTWEEGPEVRRTWQTAMVRLTRLLLGLGASPAGVNRDGNGVLHFLAPNLDRYDVAALFTELVRDYGLDVNARNARGETPLTHFASRRGTLRRLCGVHDYEMTLDDHAAREAVAALKALGADFGVVDARTGDGLLHLAAMDTVQLFKAVMDCGGLDPTKENMAHQTAIDVAAMYNNNEILALFEKSVRRRCGKSW